MKALWLFLALLLPVNVAGQELSAAACANRAAAAEDPELNVLSAARGPRALMVEVATGDWGKSLGPSRILLVECRSGAVSSLVLEGITDISEPWFDPDSTTLYFVSADSGQRDIWRAEWLDGRWGRPEHLPAPINSPNAEYSPVVRGGSLYFASARDGGGDLYRVALTDHPPRPQKLPDTVNSKHGEWNLWLSSDERTIIFESSGRPSNRTTPGDLYRAVRLDGDNWSDAEPLSRLNSDGSDLNPRLIGNELVFASQVPGRARVRLLSASYSPAGWSGPLSGGGRWVDLSHGYSDETVYWPTAPGFEKETDFEGMTDGGWYYTAYSVATAEHGGTHLDAPIHFFEGRQTTDQIPLERLIGEAVVIDVSAPAAADADYQISVDDLLAWEARHGELPAGAIVLFRTDFSQRWPDAARYLGTAERGEAAVAKLHFPGLAPELARFLVEQRVIASVGIDTASIDFGQTRDFMSHRILFEHNIPAFENLARLDQLPPTGVFVVALPMKIEGGSGGPLRIVAHLPLKPD